MSFLGFGLFRTIADAGEEMGVFSRSKLKYHSFFQNTRIHIEKTRPQADWPV
jgi:hypothetical protein